ncbi:hypothetical protein J4410_06675 [Candidatus Woesearchaeota archaeon]|nr:hypothetical protein [Candidatus Woesearchaeota archaeon]
MSDLVYVLDAAPITTRGNETWSSKVFRRHLPPLYFFQSLQGPQPLGLVTPVFDAAGTRSYDELQPYITADLSRHTALGNVHVIDEARRKVPTDPEQVERHVAFLNSLDFDLRELDTTQALVYQGDRITGFSVGDGKRVSCTVAEALVYHDKMELVREIPGNVVCITGYDESYEGLYGVDSTFRRFTSALLQGLQREFRRPTAIVSFMYGTNPCKMPQTEYDRNFADFNEAQQEDILATNALYTLVTAHLFQQGPLTKEELRALRTQCNEHGRNLKSSLTDLLQTPIRSQANFDTLAQQAHALLPVPVGTR